MMSMLKTGAELGGSQGVVSCGSFWCDPSAPCSSAATAPVGLVECLRRNGSHPPAAGRTGTSRAHACSPVVSCGAVDPRKGLPLATVAIGPRRSPSSNTNTNTAAATAPVVIGLSWRLGRASASPSASGALRHRWLRSLEQLSFRVARECGRPRVALQRTSKHHGGRSPYDASGHVCGAAGGAEEEQNFRARCEHEEKQG